jgi:hypothetical protein
MPSSSGVSSSEPVPKLFNSGRKWNNKFRSTYAAHIDAASVAIGGCF